MSQCFFYEGLSLIAGPLRLFLYLRLYLFRTQRDCVSAPYPGRTPRMPYPARIPCRHLLQCRDIKPVCSGANIVPTQGLCRVRACSCKPSQSTVPPTLGWELKKFTKSSSRWTIQPENPNRMQRMKGIKVNGPPTQILGKFFGIRFFDALFQNFAANCEPLSPPVPQLTSEGS